jgi:hypothetical protein
VSKVSNYSVLVYSGEQGYQNNRAQITLADSDGNSLAFVRFKDPGMPCELDTETDGIIPCISRQRCLRATSTSSATRRPTSSTRSGAPSCLPS